MSDRHKQTERLAREHAKLAAEGCTHYKWGYDEPPSMARGAPLTKEHLDKLPELMAEAQRNRPRRMFMVGPREYDRLKALGVDMSHWAVNAPIPIAGVPACQRGIG